MKVEKLVKNFCIKIKVSPQLFFYHQYFYQQLFSKQIISTFFHFLIPFNNITEETKIPLTNFTKTRTETIPTKTKIR